MASFSRPVVVDAGPLIRIDSGSREDLVRMRSLLHSDCRVMTSVAVACQVVRQPARQHLLMRILEAVELVPLTEFRDVSRMLATSKSSDVVDAHVAAIAEEIGGAVWTHDIKDLKAFGVDLLSDAG